MGNSTKTGNKLRPFIQSLMERLPPGWKILESNEKSLPIARGDATLKIRAPRGSTGSVFVQIKERLEPKDVDSLAAPLRSPSKLPIVILAPFISERTQQRLKERGMGYADLTGNVCLSVSEPGLFIQTSGAVRNPVSTFRERTSLRGAKAGRLIRALCDFRPPTGIRELAKRTSIDAGYISRIMDFLDREALITRRERGPITSTDWAGLIRRWSQEYSPLERKRASWYLAPRGVGQIVEQLKSVSIRYVVSGSWAAAQFAPVSPTRLFLCYADEPSALSRTLDIRPADDGANVALITPFDPVVYERTSQKDGLTMAAVSQIATDLFGTPGRGPNEAEALLAWMQDNEHGWRS